MGMPGADDPFAALDALEEMVANTPALFVVQDESDVGFPTKTDTSPTQDSLYSGIAAHQERHFEAVQTEAQSLDNYGSCFETVAVGNFFACGNNIDRDTFAKDDLLGEAAFFNRVQSPDRNVPYLDHRPEDRNIADADVIHPPPNERAVSSDWDSEDGLSPSVLRQMCHDSAGTDGRVCSPIDDFEDLVGELLRSDSPMQPHSMVPHFHCMGCDFQILRAEEFVWSDDVEYLFFRNNYPQFDKLKRGLLRRGNSVAYCCQCSWKSASVHSDLNVVADGMRWKIINADGMRFRRYA